MRENCNESPLTFIIKDNYFDSYMREDCNGCQIHSSFGGSDFDLCMREDCNAGQGGFQLQSRDFDSCMREDCNKPRVLGGGASFILIHACARIATVLGGIVMARTNFNSCMREDCNRSGGACMSFTRFRFMHARRLQQRQQPT